jgi:type II secretory pathway component PulJ
VRSGAAVCFQIRRMNERMKKDKTLRRRMAQIEKQLQQEKEA